MNFNDNILPYLKKQLPKEDSVVFEKHLRENPDFGNKVQEERRILEQMELKRLRNKFAALHEEEKNNVVVQIAAPTARVLTMPFRQRIAPYAMAASVVGLLLFSYFHFFTNPTNEVTSIANNTELNSNSNTPQNPNPTIANNNKPQQTTTNSNSNTPQNRPNNSNNQILDKSNTQQKYDLAYQGEIKNISGELMSTNNENSLDAAKSFLKKNKTDEAITVLSQLLKNNPTDEDVEWFLTVALLKNNQEKAFINLKKIATQDSKYQDKAVVLMIKLAKNN